MTEENKNNQPISNFLRNLSEKLRDPESNARKGIQHTTETMKDGFEKAGEKIVSGYEKAASAVNDFRNEISERSKMNNRVDEELKSQDNFKKDTSRSDHMSNIFANSTPADIDVEKEAQKDYDNSSLALRDKIRDQLGASEVVEDNSLTAELDKTYKQAVSSLAHSEADLMKIENRIAEAVSEATDPTTTLNDVVKNLTEKQEEAVEEVTEEAANSDLANSIIDMINNSKDETESVVEAVEEKVEAVVETVKEEATEVVENVLNVFNDATGVNNVLSLSLTSDNGTPHSVASLNEFAKDSNVKFVKLVIDTAVNKDGKTKTALALEAIAKFEARADKAKSAAAVKTVFLINAKNSTAGLIKVLQAVENLSEKAQADVAGVIIQTGKRPLAATVKNRVRVAL